MTYRYHCYEIEDSIEMHTAVRSRLRWMKENEPYAFAELVIQGDMKQLPRSITESI
ncbi:DUF6061 family protein [Paenibacillus polymyxa]|uniref:DUF6061 family protein n=1 Tax=Paenibacillus polymyxa TaxID=1406 RepID=UPI0035A2CB34